MRLQFNKVAYTGGHPDHQRPGQGLVLVVDDAGIHLRRFTELFLIPWREVVELAAEGPDQAAQRLTFTRLATLGVFAFAAKKTTSEAYLSVRTAGYEVGFQVPKTSAGELRAKLGRWMTQPAPAPQPAYTPTPPPHIPPPQPAPSVSVADELERLAQLHAAGHLTYEQFEAAKARILGS